MAGKDQKQRMQQWMEGRRHVSLYLTDEEWAALERRRQETGLSKSLIVRLALRKTLGMSPLVK